MNLLWIPSIPNNFLQAFYDISHVCSTGFLARRVQEQMDRTKAARPFNSSVFGTLREKNNTIMNFVNTLEEKQKEKKEEERIKAIEINVPIEIDNEEDIKLRDASYNDYEPKKDEDVKGNPLILSNERSNVLTEGLFIGSVYVGREDQGQIGEPQDSDKSSWRVRL